MIDPKQLLTPEINQAELNTKEKRQKVAMDLQALRASPGWIFIERVLKIHIDKMGETILNDDSLEQEAEREMKKERVFLALFKSIPSEWVQELMQAGIETRGESDDPYELEPLTNQK